jgi:F420-0:gamma-glutamyl ligase
MKLKLNEVDFLKEQLTQTRKELADKIADAQNLSMGLERKEEELFESRQKI